MVRPRSPLLNSLSRGRVIPGLNGQTGLLPAQKHAAAAALTRLERARHCIVVGSINLFDFPGERWQWCGRACLHEKSIPQQPDHPNQPEIPWR